MSEFDPDKYIKARIVKFNPDAYLKAKKDLPSVGPIETGLGKFAEAIPFGKTIGAGIGTTGVMAARALGLGPYGSPGARLTDKAKAELAANGTQAPSEEIDRPGWVETFRQTRDAGNQRVESGGKQNPLAGYVGTGLGIGASLMLPGAQTFKGATALGRLGNAALTAGGYGALSGAANGPADLTKGEFGQFANDVVGADGLRRTAQSLGRGRYLQATLDLMGSGGVGGAITGLGVGGVIEGARPLLTKTLKALAIRKGKDVLQGGSDIAAPTRKQLSDDAVEEVLRSGGMRATTADTYAAIEKLAAGEGAKYGQIIADLESHGVRGPEAKAIAEKLMDRFREKYTRAPANKAVPQAYADEAENLINSTRPGPGMEGPQSQTLGLSQAEEIKQGLQTQARFERLNNSPTEEARQEIASMVREANEEAVSLAGKQAGAESDVGRLAADFVPTKQRLGRLIEARTAAERGAVKATARSSGPGLPDLLLGATTGNPATAYITAMASKSLRSRLPSMMSRGAYNSSEALRTGAASPAMAKYTALLFGDEPTQEEKTQALLDALRNR